jgi:hypothetical protein
MNPRVASLNHLVRQQLESAVSNHRCRPAWPARQMRTQLIATIDKPVVIQRILAHPGLPGARAGPPSPFAAAAARAEQTVVPDMTL